MVANDVVAVDGLAINGLVGGRGAEFGLVVGWVDGGWVVVDNGGIDEHVGNCVVGSGDVERVVGVGVVGRGIVGHGLVGHRSVVVLGSLGHVLNGLTLGSHGEGLCVVRHV